MNAPIDSWSSGEAYDSYMGRWSRPLARVFLGWLAPEPAGRWLDVGCGTGALAGAICEMAGPLAVFACDPSSPFIDHARAAVRDDRVSFSVAAVERLPDCAHDLDYAVSGLALNFFPDAAGALGGMSFRLRRGGTVAAYVWDYSEGIEFLRRFWDSAVALDPAASGLDEGRRFPLCRPEPLRALFSGAGLRGVTVGAVEIATRFRDFDDFWTPFLGGPGPAPAYVARLSPEHRSRLRDHLARSLPRDADGGIPLEARAWAVRGAVA